MSNLCILLEAILLMMEAEFILHRAVGAGTVVGGCRQGVLSFVGFGVVGLFEERPANEAVLVCLNL